MLVARRRRGGGTGGAAAVSAGRATAVSAVGTVGAEGVVAARRRRGGGTGGATVVSDVAFAGADGLVAARRRRADGERGATVVSAVEVAGADGVAAARRCRWGGAGGASVASAAGVVAATTASAAAGRAARGAVAGVAARRTRRRGGAPAATRATVTAGPTGQERREGDVRSGMGATNAGRRGVTGHSMMASKRNTRTAAGEEQSGCRRDDVDAADEETAAVPTDKKGAGGSDGGSGRRGWIASHAAATSGQWGRGAGPNEPEMGRFPRLKRSEKRIGGRAVDCGRDALSAADRRGWLAVARGAAPNVMLRRARASVGGGQRVAARDLNRHHPPCRRSLHHSLDGPPHWTARTACRRWDGRACVTSPGLYFAFDCFM